MIDPILLGTAGEEDRDAPRGSAYASKKDVKWVILGVAGLGILLYPAYGYMKRISDVHVCASNMNAIYKAVSLYAQDNDNRFPPIAEEIDPRTGAPTMVKGRVSSWMSQAFRYDPRPSIYSCPAATDEEKVPNEGRVENPKTHQMETVTFMSTYGMYRPYGGEVVSNVERSSQTIVIAETSNHGAEGSFDPLPFPGSYDGFAIDWSTGNVQPGPMRKDEHLRVTRLAFRDARPGSNGTYGRHDFIHGITADGNLIRLTKSQMEVQVSAGRPKGLWSVPPLFGRK